MNLYNTFRKITDSTRKGILASFLIIASFANAQYSYTGGTYTQNFDSLATTGTTNDFLDGTTLVGWYLKSGDTGYIQNDLGAFSLVIPNTFSSTADQYRADNGSSNTGDVYSFGATASTERALGSIGSATPPDFFIGFAMKNDTGGPLASFTVTYDGEQWRLGGSNTGTTAQNVTNRPETVYFYYRIGGTDLDKTGIWTPVTALNFTSPTFTPSASGAALNGNDSANRVAGITATISSPVQANDVIWIMWVDVDSAGGDHGMAIDNLTITTTAATAGAPVITSATSIPTPEATTPVMANRLFEYQITASGSPNSYSASNLPSWLSINTASGLLSGTPTAPGVFPVTVSATNGTGTGSAVVTITISPDDRAPVVTAGQVITHIINTPLSYKVDASNAPTSYTIGTLPAGLSFDTVTGTISGTPTATANFTNITVTATNTYGTGSNTINIALVSAPIYTGDLVISAYAGTANFSYTLPFDQAPFANPFTGLEAIGLSNLANTTISGTITSTPGTYPIAVSATNDYGTTNVSISLIVMDSAAQSEIPQSVVVNKFSNSDPDRVELLVTGGGIPASTVDMRGMILKDFSGSTVNDGGGRYTFTSNALWSSVKAGTLIVLSNGTTATEDTDASDYVLAVNLGNTAYFSRLGTFDIATTEMVMIKAAGTGTGGVAGGIHALSSGSITATQYANFTGPKAGNTTQTPFPTAIYVNNSTSTLSDYTGTGATSGVALTGVTFGAANNAANQAFITYLKGAPTATALETWRQTNFGSTANTGSFADSADYDNDGIANLVEYATGTNPTAANANPVTVATKNNAGQFLTLSFNRINDPALTYTILASNDLTGGFTSTGTTYTGSAADTVVYEDTVSLATPGVRRFLRLQVSYGTP